MHVAPIAIAPSSDRKRVAVPQTCPTGATGGRIESVPLFERVPRMRFPDHGISGAYNAAAEFVDAAVARGFGEKVAFCDGARALTYAQLHERSCRMAAALASLGVRRESRIALLINDTVDFPIAFFGAVRAGMVAVPLNTFLNLEQYAYVLADSRARALVAAAPLARSLAPMLDRAPCLRKLILT